MRKIFFLLTFFCLFYSSAFSAVVPKTNIISPPFYHSSPGKVFTGSQGSVRREGRTKHLFTKIKRIFFERSKSLPAAIDEIETPRWKKVLSVLALSLGGLTALLFFAAPGLLAFTAAGAIVSGIIALPNNPSKKHRKMAAWGIVIAVVFPLTAIVGAYMFSNMFSGFSLY